MQIFISSSTILQLKACLDMDRYIYNFSVFIMALSEKDCILNKTCYCIRGWNTKGLLLRISVNKLKRGAEGIKKKSRNQKFYKKNKCR